MEIAMKNETEIALVTERLKAKTPIKQLFNDVDLFSVSSAITRYFNLPDYSKAVKRYEESLGPRLSDPEPEVAPKANGELTAAFKRFTERHEAIQKSFAIRFENIKPTAQLLQRLLPEANLAHINDWLASKHKRQLGYEDIAVVWLAHCHNVKKNTDNSSPIKGIVGLAKVAKIKLSNLHVSAILDVFIALKLTRKTREANHDESIAATYEIINPDLKENKEIKN